MNEGHSHESREPSLVGRGAYAWTGSWWAVGVLVFGVAAARLAYLAWWCPYDLIEDEAHYWEWSRRLDWSYYSKGPGIAWAIAAGTALLGVTELGVRAASVVAGAVAALAVAVLGTSVARGDVRVGFFGAALVMLAPFSQVTSLLATIDGGYIACWAVAALAAWVALERAGRWAWVVLGLALGVGFLFKYTILLLPVGIALYALLRHGRVNVGGSWRRWAVAGAVVMAAACAPVGVWNAQHGWPTVRHLMGHLGMPGGDMERPTPAQLGYDPAVHDDCVGDGERVYDAVLDADPAEEAGGRSYTPVWTLEFMGAQLGIVGPGLLLAVGGVVWTVRRRGEEPEDHSGRLFLVCCGGPIVVFYLLVTLVAPAEGNWAIGGYMTLLVLAGWFVVRGLDRLKPEIERWRAITDRPRPWRGYLRRRPENGAQQGWHWALGYGLVTGLGMLRLDVLAELPVIERAVPIGRLIGPAELASHVDAERARVRDETGLEPLVMAEHYGRASQMAFYLEGRPRVFCPGPRVGGRLTQYDFWEDTDPDDAVLRGRPGVLLGATCRRWRLGFGRVETLGVLPGEAKGDRPAFVGYDYTGFALRGNTQ